MISHLSVEEIQNIKKLYPKGTLIEVIESKDEYNPHEQKLLGIVSFVDDIGTLHVQWENGRTLGIIPGIDEFRKLELIGRFSGHSGQSGIAFKDELGRRWMRFKGEQFDLPANSIYVKEWKPQV